MSVSKLGSTVALGAAIAVGTLTHAQPPAAQDRGRHSLEAYVSEDALQAKYMRELDVNEIGRTEIAGGVFFNEARDLIAVGGALSEVGAPEEARRWRLRVGPHMYGAFLNGEDEDVFGIGLGGDARYYFGADRTSALVLTAYYAPDILTFGIADNVTDVSVRFETRLRPGTMIFLGYRTFEFDLPVDREVDDNLHIGFRRDF